MTNDEYLSAWKQLVWRETTKPRVTTIHGFPNVVIPEKTLWNIYDQLIALKGQRCVFFCPGDDDSDMAERYHMHHHDEHIIGSLLDVAKRANPESMDDHIFAKVSTEEKFRDLPLRGYELNLGLHCEDNVWENTNPKFTSKGWPKSVLLSCKVKGLYWYPMRNENHPFGQNFLSAYYELRNLGMYIYQPGQAYY